MLLINVITLNPTPYSLCINKLKITKKKPLKYCSLTVKQSYGDIVKNERACLGLSKHSFQNGGPVSKPLILSIK